MNGQRARLMSAAAMPCRACPRQPPPGLSQRGRPPGRGPAPEDTVLLRVASTVSCTAALHVYAALFVAYTAPCKGSTPVLVRLPPQANPLPLLHPAYLRPSRKALGGMATRCASQARGLQRCHPSHAQPCRR